MLSTAALIARDQRILAGDLAGATVIEFALTEEVDPATVRQVLCAAAITPNPIRNPADDHATEPSKGTSSV